MRVPLLIIAAFALIILESNQGLAQDENANPLEPGKTKSAIYIGPVAGYNRSIHSVDLPSFGDIICPHFKNGSSNGYYFGLSFEYPIGNIADSRHSIIARALYNSLPSFLVEKGDNYPSLVPQYTNNGKGGIDTSWIAINSQTEHSVDVNYNLITFELMYKFNVIKTLGITFGPTFDLALSPKIKQYYKIINPDNVQFKVDTGAVNRGEISYSDDRRTINVANETLKPENLNKFRVGIKAGIQYEIIMNGKYYIVPAVYYNFGITNVTKKLDWKVSAFQAGVDVRFAIGG